MGVSKNPGNPTRDILGGRGIPEKFWESKNDLQRLWQYQDEKKKEKLVK